MNLLWVLLKNLILLATFIPTACPHTALPDSTYALTTVTQISESTYLPNDEVVVVLATERGEIFLVFGEAQRLDVHFVQFEAVHNLQRVKVPNDDISLQHNTIK